MREDGGDGEAAGALNIHEEGAGRRHKSLENLESVHAPWWLWCARKRRAVVCPPYLELVLTGLSLRRGVEEVERENLVESKMVSILILFAPELRISR